MKLNIYLIILVLLSGCSADWHLKQIKRHTVLAEAKGAKIEKEIIRDTIKITLKVKGDSGRVDINPVIDEVDFFEDMEKNDSLLLSIVSLQKSISNSVIDREKSMAALDKANAQIKILRKRIAQGYTRDSTYTYADSLCFVRVSTRDGLLDSVFHKRKDIKAEKTEIVPVEIRKIFNSGYSVRQIIGMTIGLGILLLIIGFMVGYIAGK